MRVLGTIALALVAIIGGVVVCWNLNFPTYTYRYRMTVDIDAKGKLYSSSSVIQVVVSTQPHRLLPVTPITTRTTGEAVFVDLGEGRNIIALLATGDLARNVDYPAQIVPRHFGLARNRDEDIARYSNLEGRWTLAEPEMPSFVTFENLNDPKTAKLVAPSELESAFGPDVRLKSVAIELTSAPITYGLLVRLRCLSGFMGTTEKSQQLYSLPTDQ